jgi:ubiquinone/menaquinone biosynthesis C-methylase UbiE
MVRGSVKELSLTFFQERKMTSDPFKAFKAAQRESWGLFAPLEAVTTPGAAFLVNFARTGREMKLLDVGCGTGVVAVTAARRGARVTGLDLSPVLLERARWNAKMAQTEIEFLEGDVEALPFADGAFDLVLSQFGHMFAPRPEVAITEMLRVLKPGGHIAFSTWPPELFMGQLFSLVNRYQPLPAGVASTPEWGDPRVVTERLGKAVTELSFERDIIYMPLLSPFHYCHTLEKTAGPVVKLVEACQQEPERLDRFRSELVRLVLSFTEANLVRQSYLATRAKKL